MKYFKAHKNKISETTFINALPEGIHLSSFSSFLVIITHVVVVFFGCCFSCYHHFHFFFFFLSILLLIVVVLSLYFLVVKARFSLSLVFLQLLSCHVFSLYFSLSLLTLVLFFFENRQLKLINFIII